MSFQISEYLICVQFWKSNDHEPSELAGMLQIFRSSLLDLHLVVHLVSWWLLFEPPYIVSQLDISKAILFH